MPMKPLSLPIAVLLVVGGAIEAGEPVWLQVEDLIVDQIEPVLSVKGQPSRKLGLAVRGVFPLERQLANLAASGLAEDRFEVVDFTIQRQSMPVGAVSAAKGWEDASIATLAEVLQSSDGFAVDIVDATKLDAATSMPLPMLAEGAWGHAVSHLKLRPDVKQLLYRFVDFEVERGHYYRYRVKLEVRNPNFKQTAADPFLAEGATRETPWSQPSAAILVESKASAK
jgi:hypothetical protein